MSIERENEGGGISGNKKPPEGGFYDTAYH